MSFPPLPLPTRPLLPQYILTYLHYIPFPPFSVSLSPIASILTSHSSTPSPFFSIFSISLSPQPFLSSFFLTLFCFPLSPTFHSSTSSLSLPFLSACTPTFHHNTPFLCFPPSGPPSPFLLTYQAFPSSLLFPEISFPSPFFPFSISFFPVPLSHLVYLLLPLHSISLSLPFFSLIIHSPSLFSLSSFFSLPFSPIPCFFFLTFHSFPLFFPFFFAPLVSLFPRHSKLPTLLSPFFLLPFPPSLDSLFSYTPIPHPFFPPFTQHSHRPPLFHS